MASFDPDWLLRIRDWAEAQPEVVRVWIFGSRARNTAYTQSDLDIGIELEGEEGIRLADWMGNRSDWESALQELLPIQIQLELADPVHTPDKVWPAIERDGVKIFDRSELYRK